MIGVPVAGLSWYGPPPGAEDVTCVLVRPVFAEGGARRRRLLSGAGATLAGLCAVYLVMLGVSITASPVSGRQVEGASGGETARVAAGYPPRSRPAARVGLSMRLTGGPDADRTTAHVVRAPAVPVPTTTPVRATRPSPRTAKAGRVHRAAATTRAARVHDVPRA